MRSDVSVSMIQLLGVLKVNHAVELSDCAKIVVDEDSVICVYPRIAGSSGFSELFM